MSHEFLELGPDRQQWLQKRLEMPLEDLAEALIKEAYMALDYEGGARARMLRKRIDETVHPEICETNRQAETENRQQLQAQQFADDVENWLNGRDTQTYALNDHSLEEEEAERKAEEITEIRRIIDNELAKAELTWMTATAEIRDRIEAENLDVRSVKKVLSLQKELGEVISGDRIRKILANGEGRNFDVVKLLAQNAMNGDYESLFIAVDKLRNLRSQNDPKRFQLTGFGNELVYAAAKFIEPGKPDIIDKPALNAGLYALAQLDPNYTFYGVTCAKLGSAIRDFRPDAIVMR